MKISFFWVFLCLCHQLFCDFSYICLDGGYRWDKISNKVNLFDDDNKISSKQSAHNLNSYYAGVKGMASFCDWFFKGDYHFVWIDDGRYKETDNSGTGVFGKAWGHTNEALGGVGHFFGLEDCCWGVVPYFGWSYDQLVIKTKDLKAKIKNDQKDPGHIKFKSRFQGPWVGADILLYPNPCYQIAVGYEFHWAHWHSIKTFDYKIRHKRINPRKAVPPRTLGVIAGFSSKRKDQHVLGNVLHLDSAFILNKNSEVGFALKYAIWRSAAKGHFKRLKDSHLKGEVHDIVWDSFSATIHWGYAF